MMVRTRSFPRAATPSLTLPLRGGGKAHATAVSARLTLSAPSCPQLLGCFPPPRRGRVREGVLVSGFRTELQKAQAKALRRQMTPAERVLWHHLRAHRFMGLSVRRQAPVGSFIVDFLIPEHRLILEADGGGHGGSADERRDHWLESHGFRVLRFWNGDVLGNLDGCLNRIATKVAP